MENKLDVMSMTIGEDHKNHLELYYKLLWVVYWDGCITATEAVIDIERNKVQFELLPTYWMFKSFAKRDMKVVHKKKIQKALKK